MVSGLPPYDLYSVEDARLRQLFILREMLMRNTHDAAAWFQLAALIGDPEREIFCLEQVLKVDPTHAAALARLETLRASPTQTSPEPESSPAWKEARCQYVGLVDDPQSLAAYPSPMNFCYRLDVPKLIKLDYQQQYCLDPAHQCCLVFQRVRFPLPKLPGKNRFCRPPKINPPSIAHLPEISSARKVGGSTDLISHPSAKRRSIIDARYLAGKPTTFISL